MNGHDVPSTVTGIGSITAFGAGVLAVAIPPIETPAMAVALGGLVTAIGGLLGSLGNQLVAAYRVWSEQRRAERQANAGLYELKASLELANREIDRLNRVIQENASHYDSLFDRLLNLRRGDLQAFVSTKKRQLEDRSPDDLADRRVADLEDALDQGLKRLGAEEKPKVEDED